MACNRKNLRWETHLCDIRASGLRAEGTSKYGMCSILSIKTFSEFGIEIIKTRWHLVGGSKHMVGELALSEKLSRGVGHV